MRILNYPENITKLIENRGDFDIFADVLNIFVQYGTFCNQFLKCLLNIIHTPISDDTGILGMHRIRVRIKSQLVSGDIKTNIKGLVKIGR